jgi:hypothetical protein
MQVASGKGADSQWFDYRTTFFGPVIRVEWDLDTMYAALPSEAAGYLLAHGYAKPMTDAEIEAYTAPPAEPEKAKPSKKGKEP